MQVVFKLLPRVSARGALTTAALAALLSVALDPVAALLGVGRLPERLAPLYAPALAEPRVVAPPVRREEPMDFTFAESETQLAPRGYVDDPLDAEMRRSFVFELPVTALPLELGQNELAELETYDPVPAPPAALIFALAAGAVLNRVRRGRR